MNTAVLILTILDIVIRDFLIPGLIGILVYKFYRIKKREYMLELRNKKYDSLAVDRYCH